MTASGTSSVVVLPDPEAVAVAAAEEMATTLAASVAARGRTYLGTTGGSTPAGPYRHLAIAPLRDRVPWDDVEIWFGDDRFVPRDHPLSNVLPVDQVLLRAAAYTGQSGGGDSGVDIERGHRSGDRHAGRKRPPVPVRDRDRGRTRSRLCAETYAEQVQAAMPLDASGWPLFDLLFLGIGPTGTSCRSSRARTLTATARSPRDPRPTHVEPHVERVTLNPAIVGAARRVLVVVLGTAKAAILGEVFGPIHDPTRWPAQLALRAGATWFIDEAARGRASGGCPPRLTGQYRRTGRRGPPSPRHPSAGRPADAGEIAEVYLASFHARYDFPLAHTDDQVRDWFRGQVESPRDVGGRDRRGRRRGSWSSPMATSSSSTSTRAGGAAARQPPRRPRQGATTRQARALHLPGERGAGVLRRRGFSAVAFGDGSGNEEGQPDVRYAWRPGA
jgi:6-phosphogluconolactonase